MRPTHVSQIFLHHPLTQKSVRSSADVSDFFLPPFHGPAQSHSSQFESHQMDSVHVRILSVEALSLLRPAPTLLSQLSNKLGPGES